MIVTLTPNPSLDRTVEVDRLLRGSTRRATVARVDPGGKGINVARALVANGHKARAVAISGGAEGRQLVELLDEEGLDLIEVPVAHPLRTNISIVEPDGVVTKFNVPGPRLSIGETKALVDAARHAAESASWVVCCGSLPPGVPDDFYASLVGVVREAGVRVAVDSSGPWMAEALEAGPDLVKPNAHELEEIAGRRLETLGDVIDASAEVHGKGVGAVLTSLGADGAVLVDGSGVLYGRAVPPRVQSAVGAGDALLAGYLSNGDGSPFVNALAWGAAAVALPGSRMPGPRDIDSSSVTVTDSPDRSQRLKGDL